MPVRMCVCVCACVYGCAHNTHTHTHTHTHSPRFQTDQHGHTPRGGARDASPFVFVGGQAQMFQVCLV